MGAVLIWLAVFFGLILGLVGFYGIVAGLNTLLERYLDGPLAGVATILILVAAMCATIASIIASSV